DPNVPGSGTVTTTDGPFTEVCQFSNLTPVIVHDVPSFTFRTAGSHDVLTVDSPEAGQNRIGGTSDGVAFETATFYNVPEVPRAAGPPAAAGADPNDLITVPPAGLVASGLQTFRVAAGVGQDTLTLPGGSYALPAGGALTFTGGAVPLPTVPP